MHTHKFVKRCCRWTTVYSWSSKSARQRLLVICTWQLQCNAICIIVLFYYTTKRMCPTRNGAPVTCMLQHILCMFSHMCRMCAQNMHENVMKWMAMQETCIAYSRHAWNMHGKVETGMKHACNTSDMHETCMKYFRICMKHAWNTSRMQETCMHIYNIIYACQGELQLN